MAIGDVRSIIEGDQVRLRQVLGELFAKTILSVSSDMLTLASDLKFVSDALFTEISDRASAIKYVSDALSTEISDRKSAIKYISDALFTDVSGNQSDIKWLSDALSTEVSDRASAIKFISDEVLAVSGLLYPVSDAVVALQSDAAFIFGTIEDVDTLPDPAVEGKVVRLTTDYELYIGKMVGG